jgi:hypothetical protein
MFSPSWITFDGESDGAPAGCHPQNAEVRAAAFHALLVAHTHRGGT